MFAEPNVCGGLPTIQGREKGDFARIALSQEIGTKVSQGTKSP